jgi:hypothetical protein
MRIVFKNVTINVYFNLSFFCSVETWSVERRRRSPPFSADGGAAGPLSGLGRIPRLALW